MLGAFIISVMDGSSFDADVDAIAVGAGGGGNIDGAGGLGGCNISFSCIILPPRFDVFSTCKAIDIPCSCLPNPWPSLNPYLAIIFAATEPEPNAFGTPLFCSAGMIGVLSCKDGGGAIAAPIPRCDGGDFLNSSKSSDDRPAKPENFWGGGVESRLSFRLFRLFRSLSRRSRRSYF